MDNKKQKFKKIVEQIKKENSSKTMKELVELAQKDSQQQDEKIDGLQKGQEQLESELKEEKTKAEELPGDTISTPAKLETPEPSLAQPVEEETLESIQEKIKKLEIELKETTERIEIEQKKQKQEFKEFGIESDDNEKVRQYKIAAKNEDKTVEDHYEDRRNQGQGVLKSVGGGISDKLKNFATGLKEEWNPLNISRNIAGRGAAKKVGKFLGKDESEIRHFTETDEEKEQRLKEKEETEKATKVKKPTKGKKTTEKVTPTKESTVSINKPETATQTTPNNSVVPQKAIEETDSSTTASKVKSSATTKNLTGILTEIYGFLKKNREEDITEREEEKSVEEDAKLLKEIRHKELIEALKGLSGDSQEGTAKKEKPEESGGGILETLGSLLGAKKLIKGGAKGAAEGASKGAAKGAVGAAEGVAKSATKVSKFLEGAKGVLKFLQKIPGLSMIAAGATLIWDVKNAIDAHEAGQLDDMGLKKQITKSLGGALGGLGGAEIGGLLGGALGSVIPGAGTLVGGILGGAAGFFGGEKLGEMAAEKAFDFFAGGQEKDPPDNPAKEADKLKKEGSKPTTSAAGPAPAAPTGSPATGGKPAPAGGGGSSASPATGGKPADSIGGGGTPPAGGTGGAGAGGGESKPSMPTASPMGAGGGTPGAAGGASSGAAPATPSASTPAAPATATPAPPPPPAAGGALASMTQQNQSMKLDAATEPPTTTVNNNTIAAPSNNKPAVDTSKAPLPAVRNKEPTFERLVYYSTRVV